MTSKEIETAKADIEHVLVNEFAIKRSKISLESLISRDLGIDGDDADDLIKFLEEKTGARIDIDLSKYFHGEGVISFRKAKDISVGDLAKLIIKSRIT